MRAGAWREYAPFSVNAFQVLDTTLGWWANFFSVIVQSAIWNKRPEWGDSAGEESIEEFSSRRRKGCYPGRLEEIQCYTRVSRPVVSKVIKCH